jgi:DNA topoisomerase VI subunit A
MAKKKTRKTAQTTRTTNGDKPKLSARDKKTLASLRNMADTVAKTAQRSRPPHLDVPSRSLSNVRYNKSKRFIEMGRGTNRRELFNLSQPKTYMQTMLGGSG